ncbi:hypothetical protein P153DRAFT_160690 [Dothidotthia symphoricarpi CBS 119687]|uniref:Uncharacterized protein n=1 Tax=Dothidotthia symphoricarpi CBS 119687 TaxID=1392245 RepID=A0A6A6ARH9_9PLEO|nr:uncharacterized protein P153DRAFT_160690 [Dothidotthia symphoricarpi CBS 119687]KAF2133595.1 hypothetical protein P153DRAFT_160690 [Dothidotthia symphoricarpi CBS 119687]
MSKSYCSFSQSFHWIRSSCLNCTVTGYPLVDICSMQTLDQLIQNSRSAKSIHSSRYLYAYPRHSGSDENAYCLRSFCIIDFTILFWGLRLSVFIPFIFRYWSVLGFFLFLGELSEIVGIWRLVPLALCHQAMVSGSNRLGFDCLALCFLLRYDCFFVQRCASRMVLKVTLHRLMVSSLELVSGMPHRSPLRSFDKSALLTTPAYAIPESSRLAGEQHRWAFSLTFWS